MNDFSEQMKSIDGQEWLALQYVLEELSEEQRAAFEEAMAVEPGLCELVVDACRLTAGVVLACEGARTAVRPSVVQPSKSMTARFGVLAACASLLALIVLLRSSVPNHPGEGTASSDDVAAADALVELLQDQLSPGGEVDGDMESVADDSLADLMVPEWLLTAVDLDEPAAVSDDEVLPDELNLF